VLSADAAKLKMSLHRYTDAYGDADAVTSFTTPKNKQYARDSKREAWDSAMPESKQEARDSKQEARRVASKNKIANGDEEAGWILNSPQRH